MQWLIKRRLYSSNSATYRRAIKEVAGDGPRGLELLSSALVAHRDPTARREIAETLGRLKNGPAVQALLQAILDPDPSVRQTAAKALGECLDGAAARALVPLLQDNSEPVRKTCASSLAQLGWQPNSVEEALAFAKVTKDYRGLNACGSAGLDALMDVLKAGATGARFAAEALGESGDVKAPQALARGLKTGGDEIKRACALSLKRLGWRPTDAEQAQLFGRAIGDYGALVAFGSVGIEALVATLTAPDAAARRSAAEALRKAGDRRGFQFLISELRAAAENPATDDAALKARRDADSRLAESGPEGTKVLIQLLEHPAGNVRYCAAHALSDRPLATDSAEELARLLASDKGGGVPDAAATALQNCAFPRGIRRAVGVVIRDIDRSRNVVGEAPMTAKSCLTFIETTLREASGQVDVNDLQSIANLEASPEFTYLYDMGKCGKHLETMTLDCRQIRQLARQELIRRGIKS